MVTTYTVKYIIDYHHLYHTPKVSTLPDVQITQVPSFSSVI